MTGHARHNADARLDASTEQKSLHTPGTAPISPNIAWIAAATACLAAFALKASHQFFVTYGLTTSNSPLAGFLDWAALLLCIGALAILMIRNPAHRTSPGLDSDRPAIPEPNIALPKSDDSRLRLAHSLSHELRTPLNAVIGFSSLLSDQLHGNLGHPKYHEYCAHISTSSQNLLRTIDDILALNLDQQNLGKIVPLPVANALTQAWKKNRTAADQLSGDLQIIDEQKKRVLANPDVLSHALGNVLDTLARNAPEGATLSATVHGDNEKTRIHCSADIDTSRVVDTAPLVLKSGDPVRLNQDTLTEAAAHALIESMDGRLTIRSHLPDGRLELICELPSAIEPGGSPNESETRQIAA
ncbi:MAG: sensor histidine kinase [Hyphomicrobiaceae bacterium]